ncbi:redox-sensitive transcriptional activator SoxR [Novosphingopyxis sp.]|uniref:redox-sensitive transcriptional activator SoxR n=1 Tax=Novosphingopyxis sp. TaxID=2709690 RepID=UPI003B5A786E
MRASDLLTIGDLARRTGLSVSAIRFYEERGLVHPMRNAGNQRRFLRADIRRLGFVLIAQRLGLTIEEIAAELAKLPGDRAPTQKDWERSSKRIAAVLDERIAALEKLRADLTGCIGCGCLSLRKCALYNKNDAWAKRGPGPRVLLAD